MKKTIFYFLVVILAASVAAAGLLYLSTRDFIMPDIDFKVFRPEERDGGATPEPDFEKTGNLLIGNPGLKPDTLYLSYEAPGSPGLQKELVFNEESSCFAGSPVACSSILSSDAEGLSGQRALVEGVLQNGAVLVAELRLLE